MTTTGSRRGMAAGAAMSLAALGMVFGDIGTSPLYAMGLLFSPTTSFSLEATPANVYGVLSTIFWLITCVVTVKYATFILRTDNDGEGGIIALFTLLREKLTRRRSVAAVTLLGFAGAALFLGDSIITPAISVMSAVEGAEVISPELAPAVVPLVLTIVVVLFAVQRLGTSKIAKAFGPVMAVWFVALAVMGANQIIAHPGVLSALNPAWALRFAGTNPAVFLVALSICLLAITGAEALYSDLGHFGRPAIVRAWLLVAFPALIINYFGQGALLLSSEHRPDNLFYAMVSNDLVIPLTLLATAATVIAAQAVISGAFSLTSQATKLGLLPRIRVRYPSGTRGQVYVAFINWTLLICVAAVVVMFGSSAGLADAYGLAVVGCMAIDTLLFFSLLFITGANKWIVLGGGIAFFALDVALIVSCLPKLFTGGWFTLMLAALVFGTLLIWGFGVSFVQQARTSREGSMARFLKAVAVERIRRLPTTAVYLHSDANTVPLSMRSTVERFGVLHAHALLVAVTTADSPHVPAAERITVDDMGIDDGVWFVGITYGFNDRVNVPDELAAAVDRYPALLEEADLDEATYYVSRFEVGYAQIPRLPGPAGRVFKLLKNAAADPIKFYKLPLDRTVTMSSHIT